MRKNVSRSPRALLVLLASLAAATSLGCTDPFETVSNADDGGDDNPQISPPTPDGSADATTDATAPAKDGGHEAATGDALAPDVEAGGEASAICAPPSLQCDAGCVSSDVNNCGACGNDCTNLPHVSGTVSCTAGACAFPSSSCASGWGDCDMNPANGCETDLSQAADCGMCGNACPTDAPNCSGSGGSYSCANGCMAPTSTLCDGTCVDTTSNASHCGGCPGDACSGVTKGQPACVNSACSITCNQAYTACPTLAPTACVDEQTDTSNCGACNDVCTTPVANAYPTCGSGQCGFACNTGYLLCNGTSCVGPDPAGLFVSPGATGTACTASAPCGTIGAALTLATSSGKTSIYLDAGTYSEVVTLGAANVSIHGGWAYGAAAGTWTNCNGTDATSIIAAPATQGATVLASGSGTWTLDTLTIQNETTASAGQSLYGVLGTAGALTLTNVSITVAAGGAGASGSQGSSGTVGGSGCTAGAGGPGSAGSPGAAAANGTYQATGFVPGNGAVGTGGGTGQNGAQPTTPACVDFTTICCAENSAHTTCTSSGDNCAEQCCGTAGDVGCGGTGSGPGSLGAGGGASIGVFSGGGGVTFVAPVSIETGTGGTGGSGGPGGTPGGAGTGTPGKGGAEGITGCAFGTVNGVKTCLGTGAVAECGGSAGSTGGAGGTGGQGGGGAGGDSFCYATGPVGAVTGSPSCTAGQGGAGGNQGLSNQGPAGHSGTHN